MKISCNKIFHIIIFNIYNISHTKSSHFISLISFEFSLTALFKQVFKFSWKFCQKMTHNLTLKIKVYPKFRQMQK